MFLDAPKHIKDRLNNEIRKLDSLTNLSPEINVVRTYIDWLFDLPWNSVTTDNDDLRDVKKKFDESHLWSWKGKRENYWIILL